MQRIKIFINTLSWYIGTSTDYKIRKRFKGLENIYPDLSFYYPKSIWISLYFNVKRIFFSILRRTKIYKPKRQADVSLLPPYHSLEFKKSECNIIYSQGVFPINIPKTPIIYDAFFLKPNDCKQDPVQEDFDCYTRTKTIFDKIVKEQVIINFRSNKSIEEAIQYWPNYSHKFVNIPFLLPNLKALPKDLIIKKHSNIRTLKILFVGAQARRKGLQQLLDALSKLWSKGYTNFELYVVSACSDGKIIFPTNIPIHYYGNKPNNFVLNLYKECHIYAMISHFESFGISYIEAQANGLISLLRDFEPQREIADYGRLGFLAKLDIQEITDKLKQILLLSENERIKMALACRENFLMKYEYNVVAKQWHNVFLQLYNE